MVANWSLAQYRRLDTPCSAAYRRILALPKKFPTALLYLSKQYCGIGLPRLSDSAQIMKWENFQRCLAVGGAPKKAITNMLNRLPQRPTPEQCNVRMLLAGRWPSHRAYTARSLVEWLAETNLHLACRLTPTLPDIISSRRNKDAISVLAERLAFWPSPSSQPSLPREHSELARLAKRLELHPDREIWAPSQTLLSVKAFFTDGSFFPRPPTIRDILTSERALRDGGIGTAGIVFDPAPVPHQLPTEAVLVRVTSPRPEPGMGSYGWELLAQLVALHLAKYLPPSVPGYSDCQGALSRTTMALRSRHDRLATTRAGIFSTAMHQLSNVERSRPFRWIRGHPETDPARRDLVDPLDRGIFMADSVAEGDTTGLRKRGLPHRIHTLNLHNIMNEIIPLHAWHIRDATDSATPVLADLMYSRHHTVQRDYLARRDSGRDVPYWTDTALHLTHKLHPPAGTSTWALARRAMEVFDWQSHGRNQAKIGASTEHPAVPHGCIHCRLPDSQTHCMLECTHPPFLHIRAAARLAQANLAGDILSDTHCRPLSRLFAEQFCTASWQIDQPHLDRIWLGRWTTTTLWELFHMAPDAPISPSLRHCLIKIATQLTAPLLDAYRQMVTLTVTTKDAHRIQQSAITPHQSPSRNIHTQEDPIRECQEWMALHPQLSPSESPPPLQTIEALSTINDSDLCASACRMSMYN